MLRAPLVAAALLLFPALAAGLAMGAPTPKAAGPAPPSGDAADFFESQVRPVLAGQCVKCHGPDKQLGGLRLDSREALLKGGGRGPAVVPGKPQGSLLLATLRRHPGVPSMPPAGALKPAEIEALARWVAAGAPWPEYSTEQSGRNLWALRPVTAPAVPRVRGAAWVRNPVDAFVLAGLEAKGMVPAPEADRRTLLRRVTLDLSGLPPTPEETAAFLADRRPDAYERAVDRLLASPRYGERWARYWLDLVRYADSSGYERDAEKPYSWKYRDYVIRSLNEDKPYNRFILEQLAGDELPGRTEETAAATGFLRVGTWDDEPNDPLQYRYDRLDDLVHATATTFLGLTVKCARCHDHKFDPVSQKEYYAFAAAFYGGYLDAGDRAHLGGPPPDRLPFQVLGYTDRGREAPELKLLVKGDPRQEGPVVPPGFLSAVGDLGHRFEPPAAGAATTGRRLRLAEWIADPKNPLTARVMVNRVWQGHFGEGLSRSPNNFGRLSSAPSHPELLDYLAARFSAPSTGSRGPGTPQPPAAGLGWSLKKLHRLIVTSSTYRMASLHPRQSEYEQVDALNTRLWRQHRRRLDADALRDAMLAASGELDLRMGGRGFMPSVSADALEGLSRKGAEWIASPPEEQRRRSVYMFLKRALIPPFMSAFDFPDTTQPLGQRDVTTVPTQALVLLNNAFTHQRADGLAARVVREAGADPARQVERAWLLAVGRAPTEAERARALAHVRQTTEALRQPGGASAGELPVTAGLRLWLRADRGVRPEDGRVAGWEDGSGAGNHASAPRPEARPALEAGTLNGRPAVRFDGQARHLVIPGSVLSSQQFTLVAVAADRSSGTDHREIFSNWRREDNVGTSVFFGLTGRGAVRLTDHFVPAGTVTAPDRPFILTGVADRAGATVFQDRAELSRKNGPLPPRNLAGPYVVGQQGNIQGEYWNGDLYELLVFDRALEDLERQQVWDALSRRYGIAAPPRPEQQALASLCRVLLNANEFIYVD